MSAIRKAGVIGWPIEHSRSPLIHGHWLQRYGIDGSYVKEAVPPEAVGAFIRGLPASGWRGCNVTVPHKQAALALADEADDVARSVGAANTLWVEGDRVLASNTDVHGFMTHLALSAPGWDKRDRAAVVLGAGGAARAIVYGLLQAGVAQIRLVNRTRERAEELARPFGKRVDVLDWQEVATALAGAGLLVNSTTLGMIGQPRLELDLSPLPAEAAVADIVYVPLSTGLLKAATARGLRTVDGLGMLLHQAVPGFERWFGVRPEVTAELRALVVASIEVR